VTLGIIPADPTPQRVYLDSTALHKYGIAVEQDCGVGLGFGTRVAVWSPARYERRLRSPALVRSHWSEITVLLEVPGAALERTLKRLSSGVEPAVKLHGETWKFHISQAKNAA
jgi:hypothetical protein